MNLKEEGESKAPWKGETFKVSPLWEVRRSERNERQTGNLGFSMERLPKRAYVKKFTIGERWHVSAREANARGEGVKRVRGIEPPSSAWKADALATVLHPLSGCWELNPGYILPRDAYYRYTTPRKKQNYTFPQKSI